MIELIIVGGLALLLISAALAPVETLAWWAGWGGHDRSIQQARQEIASLKSNTTPATAEHFVVFLPGIGDVAGENLLHEEEPFIEYIRQQLPRTVVIHDVFPYSVINLSLTGERILASFWRWLDRRRQMGKAGLVGFAINLRNLFQVAVSADQRYGPVYNLGMAREILVSLVRHGYQLNQARPITLIGSSGGGQISLGAAPYLATAINAPIRIISLGGVMSGGENIELIERIYHLEGSKDPVPKLGKLLYPARWPFNWQSAWNQQLAAGRYREMIIGPMVHNGPGGYFDADMMLPGGRSHVQQSGAAVVEVIAEFGLPTRRESDGAMER